MRWIKCSDELPEEQKTVLVTDGIDIYSAYLFFDSWNCKCNCYEGSCVDCITHWMEPPQPPGVES